MLEVRKKCEFGDPTCPCQDGDACHYQGTDPWPLPSKEQLAFWENITISSQTDPKTP